MPAAQLLSAGLELAANKALFLDKNGATKLASLAGKSCEILPIELGFPLKFIFTETQILVSAPELVETNLVETNKTRQKLSIDECRIKLSLFAVPELKDTDNITKLIKADKLDFEGNLSIAQGFAELFKSLDIDLEEELSKYLGDAVAHSLIHSTKQFHQSMLKKAALGLHTLTDAMLDEKPVAVRAIIVENFNQEVDELKVRSEHLEAKIKALEEMTYKKTGKKAGINTDAN